MLDKIKASQATKLAILIAFGFTVALIFYSHSGHKMMTGGLGEARERNDEVDEVVDKIKPILEEKTGTKYESIEVVHYKPQTVAGRNYFVKAKAKPVDGDVIIIHLRIYKDLKGNVELTAIDLDKKEDDEVKYFQ